MKQNTQSLVKHKDENLDTIQTLSRELDWSKMLKSLTQKRRHTMEEKEIISTTESDGKVDSRKPSLTYPVSGKKRIRSVEAISLHAEEIMT